MTKFNKIVRVSQTMVITAINIFLFFACSNQNTNAPTVHPSNPYFDLKAFFNNEIERIAAFKNSKKTTTVNGKVEEKRMDNVDFHSELALFSDADINRSAWIGKYAIDSTFNESRELIQLNYIATDEDLKTKNISIAFERGFVSKIEIQNASTSALAKSHELLTYIPSKGYIIESKQSIRFSADNNYRIEVQF